MNVEEARGIVTRMCMDLETFAEISPDELEAIETAMPPQVARSTSKEGWFRMELRYTPPNWEARIRAILSRPRDGAALELARALTVVWRAEKAESRVPGDLVGAVARITGESVF